MLPRTRGHLDGPPFALPAMLDALAERWWRTRPRTRTGLSLGAVVLLVMAGVTHAAASPYGPPTAVWIADRDLTIGTVLTADALHRASWPRDLVPDGALQEPIGTLVAPLPRGAVVSDLHVGEGGVAASLPVGYAAVALPPESLPELAPGTRIDLVAADTQGGATTIASDAVLLGSDGTAVWVAVERAAATQVSGAALHGAIGVVVLPP
jgi:hypothetical protein